MPTKLFLQPHHGDIAWSCGGLIAKNKDDSLVVSLFPPRSKNYWLKLKGRIYRSKKREDMQFEKLFGIRFIFKKFPSAFMRGRTVDYLFDKKLNSMEEQLVQEIRNYITDLIAKKGIKEIYCPMAQRNQIDHLIIKQAVFGLIASNVEIYYYEDFPNFLPESKKGKRFTSLEAKEIDISNVIEEKIQAVLLYESLIEAYYKSKETLVELIRKTPFETYWKD